MSETKQNNSIDPKTIDALRAQAMEASHRVRAERTALRFRRGSGPQPGDTFLFHQTAEPPVQWAVLDVDPSTEEKLLAVPVDNYPQVGSHDVEIHVDDHSRVANARCQVGISLPTWSFDPNLRAGVLEADALAEVQQKHRAIDEGGLKASLSDRLVDDDPDYQRWTAELRRMAQRLEQTVPDRAMDDLGTIKPVLSPPASPIPSSPRRWMGPMALAASLVMAVGLWSVHQQQELRETLERQRQENAALAETKGELEERLEASDGAMDDLRDQVETLDRETRTQRETMGRLESENSNQRDHIAGLKRSLEAAATPVGNLAAVTLNDRSRSSRAVIKLTDSTQNVLLQLEPSNPNIYPDYELRVIDESTDQVVITSKALAWHQQYLGIVLSVALFREAPSEKFRLELWATVDGEFQLVDAGYHLLIDRWR